MNGGLMNLLMLNPRIRQMVQAGQQQQNFQQQQRVQRMLGQAYLQMAGNNGAGTPTPGMMGDQGGGSPPSMQGPQGSGGMGPPQPPGLPPPPGQASSPADQIKQFQQAYANQSDGSTDDSGQGSNALAQTPRSTQRIGLNGQPVGPNPTVGDGQGWGGGMAQGQPQVPQRPQRPQPPIGTGGIGSSFDPRRGTPSMNADTALAMIDRRESQGRNVPNYMYDQRHTASGYHQITASTWNRYAPALGIEKASYDRPAMTFPKEQQDAVAKAIFKKEGFAPWANYDKPLANDLKKVGQTFNPDTPEGSLALNQGMAKQLDWRTLVRAIMATSPNARPEDVAEAVNGALPVMSQDSQNQWKQINAQLAAGRLQVSQQGEQDRTRLGDERNDIARQRLADQRSNAKDRIDIAKQNLQVSKDRLQFYRDKEKTATDFKSRQAAAQLARDEEKKQHDLQTEYTGALNAYSNLARSGVDMAPETPPGEGIFGGAGHKEAPEAGAARENIAKTRSNLNRGGALTKPNEKPALPSKGGSLVKKPIPPDQLAIAKQVLQSGSPEDIAAMKKELEDGGYDTSALGV